MPGLAEMPPGGLLDARPGTQVRGNDRLPLAGLAALRLHRGEHDARERHDLALYGVAVAVRGLPVQGNF
jgi:hypothetical protein